MLKPWISCWVQQLAYVKDIKKKGENGSWYKVSTEAVHWGWEQQTCNEISIPEGAVQEQFSLIKPPYDYQTHDCNALSLH